MSQTASHLATSTTSPSGLPATPSAAIDRYVAMAFGRFETVLLATVPGFVEPRVRDPEAALRLLRQVIETLVGVAVGSAVGAVASALRRGGGAETRAAVATELTRIARGGGPLAVPSRMVSLPRFLPHDDRRPLVEELGCHLVHRLRLAITHTRRHVVALVTACAEADAAIVALLDQLATDDAPALAYGDQLAAAWHHATAALHGAPPPVLPADARHARARETWSAWSRKQRGIREPVLSPAESLIADGYLMRIT